MGCGIGEGDGTEFARTSGEEKYSSCPSSVEASCENCAKTGAASAIPRRIPRDISLHSILALTPVLPQLFDALCPAHSGNRRRCGEPLQWDYLNCYGLQIFRSGSAASNIVRPGSVFQNAATGTGERSRRNGAELIRDLEMIAATVNRAQRWLTTATMALDAQQGKAVRYQIGV